jgi:hypothetical protein
VQCNLGINLSSIVEDPATFCNPELEIGVMNKLLIMAFAVPLLMYSGNKLINSEEDIKRVFNIPLFRVLIATSQVIADQQYREDNPGLTALGDLAELMQGGKKRTRRSNKKQRKTNKNKNKRK